MDQTVLSIFVSIPTSQAMVGVAQVVTDQAKHFGFVVEMRDNMSPSQRLEQLRACAVVVADITDNDPSILYEIGYATALDKPLILIAQRGTPPPTDLAAMAFLVYYPEDGLSGLRERLSIALQIAQSQLEVGSTRTAEEVLQEKEKRNQVFISYSHKDKAYLERLMVHLTPLEADGRIGLWVDTKLSAGDNWKVEIESALLRASVVILLVSADYLASEFVRNNELPQMLRMAQESGVRIIPLVLKPCRYNRHSTLRNFQALNDPANPLSLQSEDQREAEFDHVAAEVEKYA